MIRINLVDGSPLVWSADDWKKLRYEHRIVGNTIGCVAQLPRQNVANGLPIKLLPEEVTLLLEKNICSLYEYKCEESLPSDNLKSKFKEFDEKVKKEQMDFYRQKKIEEVRSMIDKIVDGKRKKNSRSNTFNQDDILKAETEKATKDLSVGLNVQIPTENPWLQDEYLSKVTWSYPTSPDDAIKYAVFKDLWEKGYYLTCGVKFGGHFLAYPGEPLKFHAFFIIYCASSNQEISASQIIAQSRLGVSTKKTFVIASDKPDGSILYNSLEWTGFT